MFSLGWQETVVIFILALLLFGPKKLPELGRTLGKALTEFRRASTELKSTFEREMRNLEQEAEPIRQAANEYQYDTYNHDYSSGSPYDHSYSAGESDFSASHPSITSASAPQGAESTPPAVLEGTVAQGALIHHPAEPVNGTHVEDGTKVPEPSAVADAPPAPSTVTEHKA
jgi:sec-independent protein translocase protein TatA